MNNVGNDRFFSATSSVVQRHPSLFRHPRQSSAGIHSPFRHTCVFVAGIYLENSQDGFPIENVGNDGGKERFPITNIDKDKDDRLGFAWKGQRATLLHLC